MRELGASPAAVFPTHDPPLNSLARHRDRLGGASSFRSRPGTCSRRSRTSATSSRSRRRGRRRAGDALPASAARRCRAAEEIGYPVLVKPSAPDGFKRAYRQAGLPLRDRGRARAGLRGGRAVRADGAGARFPAATTSCTRSAATCAADGEPLGPVLGPQAEADAARAWARARRRGSLGATRSWTRGCGCCARFGFHGVSQVEFKRDPRDGRFKLMEINPRLWQWHGLAAACGVDLPRHRLPRPDRRAEREPASTNGAGRRWAITLHARRAAGVRAAAVRRRRLRRRRSEAGARPRGPGRTGRLQVIPERSSGARAGCSTRSAPATLGFGDDVPYRAEAWEQVERGERPEGDELAEAFFHLARVEERDGPRDAARPFPAAGSCLDPLDPPLERLRRSARRRAAALGGGARFAVALTHDVDTPVALDARRASAARARKG